MALSGQIQREREKKQTKVQEFLDARGLDGVVLSRVGNFAWYTGGADNHVALSAEEGIASILVTRDSQRIICGNVEARRMMEEELSGQSYGLEEFMWYEANAAEALHRLTPGMKIGADSPISGTEMVAEELKPLRYSLTPVEIARYRWLGAACSEAISELCHGLQRRILEYEIAGEAMGALQSLGITPVAVLVGVDDRVTNYRHPIPTDKELDKYAMIGIKGRKWGLVCSLTRLVYFGKLPKDLRRKQDAVAHIDAGLIAHTHVGAKVATIFEEAIRQYQTEGFPDEWKLHPQGGATGYGVYDYRATPYSSEEVQLSQAFAWGPSISGSTSEDTMIATENGSEVISEALDWPSIEMMIGERVISRPDIMIR